MSKHETNTDISNVSFQAYEQLPVGVVVTDGNSNVQYVNRELLRLLGLDETCFVVGSSARSVIYKEDLARVNRTHKQLMNGEVEKQEFSFRYQHPKGGLRWFKATFRKMDGVDDAFVGTIMSLEEERSIENPLNKGDSRLRSIFMNAQGGIVLSNSSFYVMAANKAFAQMLGFEDDSSIRGAFLPSLTYPEDRERESELFNEMLEKRSNHYRIEKRYIGEGGEPIWCDVIVSATWDNDNRPSNFISIIQNIQQSKEDQDKMESLNRMKDKFFSILSHDLKNPISSILGLSDLVRECILENDTKGALEMLELIETSTMRVDDLLENVLDWSRSQQGMLSYRPEEHDMDEFMKELSGLLEVSFVNKSIQFEYSNEQAMTVFADRYMLRSVILNLLTNSIKFSNRGGTIGFSVEPEESGVRVSISDQGVGMSEKTIQSILAKKTTHWTNGTENETGTGLGLVLVQEFLHYHESELQIESTIGGGSTFSFHLPYQSAE
ncbi:MAG: PAS domain-containing sensor histidine kinase [Flavobacteriia bacterium]|nr:PAS domain-containing sensor histidine kinase [Flavobacteriia bacterium]